MLLAALPASSTDETIYSLPDVRKHNLGLGKKVFHEQCLACHGDIDSGAPQLGRIKDWNERIATPVGTLIEHAIHGHGAMPPKGGLETLTEHDISAAVAYVIDQGRRLMIASGDETHIRMADACSDAINPQTCKKPEFKNTLLLQMLWLITGGAKGAR